LYPCDILFIHRDAENAPFDQRISEIQSSIISTKANITIPPTIPIVPVRMLETWFLFDLHAIRRAAGNPSGTHPLGLPSLDSVEKIPNPKEILHNLLRDASELHGRRLKAFNPRSALHRLPLFIEDFTPLRNIPSFQTFERQLQQTITSCEWLTQPGI